MNGRTKKGQHPLRKAGGLVSRGSEQHVFDQVVAFGTGREAPGFARPTHTLNQDIQRMLRMKEVDELELKAEIDEISKKIDTIVQNIDRLDPTKKEPDTNQD